jgi:hypothetical protein
VAISPNFWISDALLMSESMTVVVTAAVIYLAYRFLRRPTPRCSVPRVHSPR